VRHYVPPYSPAILEEVEEVSNEWLSIPGRRERGFTLGSFSRNYVNETPLTTVLDAGGRILAFVNEIPSYRQAEATIDMMRHRSNIPNGVMDYLFLGLMLRLGQEGYQRFNLGLAPFSGVGDRPGATLQERAIHQIFEHLNRFFSYKGLRQYKAKFEPIWEERFLVCQGGLPGLLKTGIALVRVTES
jgi:phosphatidylglycerol lysyltransferase